MRNSEPVYRPPSEASSYILQITEGCSYNACTFCAMYSEKRFRVRPWKEVAEDIREAARYMPDTRRVFLADGDALVLSTARLLRVLETLNTYFPELQRVSAYADAKSILGKTPNELKSLWRQNLRLFYMGLESGSEEVLRLLRKEASAEEMRQAVQAAHESGLKSSIIVLLGAGGRALSEVHAVDTARVVSAMSPNYLSVLTLTLVPGTALAAMVEKGEVEAINADDSLRELRVIVEQLEPTRRVVFRANHASSYLPIGGILPRHRRQLLAAIDRTRAEGSFKPEWLRGL